MDLPLSYDLTYDDSVHNHHFRTVTFTLMHSYYPVCLTWNVITMPCSSTCYYCPQFLFPVTSCYCDDILVGRVGLQVIALSLRWCCIPDFHGHCYINTVLIILDNDLMMTWWFLLLLPILMIYYFYLRWDADDDVVFFRRSARRRSCRRGDDLLCSCASPAFCWWTSTTTMTDLSSPAPDALWAR